MKNRRIVITGLGALSALGEGAEPLWQAALAGRSGIGTIHFENGNYKTVGARMADFEPEKFITQRKAIKVMARDIQMAVAGAALALSDAGLKELTGSERERTGVIVGSGILNHDLDELAASIAASLDENRRLDLKRFGESGIFSLFPLWLLKYLPNMPACQISILFHLEGPNNSLTTGSSASLAAVGEAARIIERGAADVMLAGGSESKVNPVGISHYEILGSLSTLNGGDPTRVYRPLDASAAGFVVGEGSAFLVLEELEHARRRGAKIYAELVGVGNSSETGRDTAMRAALEEANVKAEQIDLLQATGVGRSDEDVMELEAIVRVFGNSKNLSVTAQKAIMGFTGFAAGAMDLVLSTLALRNGTIPPTLNFERTKKEMVLSVVKGSPLKKKIQYAMTNALGLGAPSVSVVTKCIDASS